MGLGIGGLAFIGALYHVIYNSMTKVVLFLTAGNIHRVYKSREVDRVSSVLNRMPKSGWLLLLAFFAISGIPPFGIFFSEIKIFEGILFSDKPYVLAILMVFLLFIFINMGKTIFAMLYKNGATESPERGKRTIRTNSFCRNLFVDSFDLYRNRVTRDLISEYHEHRGRLRSEFMKTLEVQNNQLFSTDEIPFFG